MKIKKLLQISNKHLIQKIAHCWRRFLVGKFTWHRLGLQDLFESILIQGTITTTIIIIKGEQKVYVNIPLTFVYMNSNK